MNARSIWPAVVLASVGAIIGCIMAVKNVPTDTIVMVASLMIVPVLSALVMGQISELKGTTNQLSNQTNGSLAQMIELLSQATPPQAPNTTVITTTQPTPPTEATHVNQGS